MSKKIYLETNIDESKLKYSKNKIKYGNSYFVLNTTRLLVKKITDKSLEVYLSEKLFEILMKIENLIGQSESFSIIRQTRDGERFIELNIIDKIEFFDKNGNRIKNPNIKKLVKNDSVLTCLLDLSEVSVIHGGKKMHAPTIKGIRLTKSVTNCYIRDFEEDSTSDEEEDTYLSEEEEVGAGMGVDIDILKPLSELLKQQPDDDEEENGKEPIDEYLSNASDDEDEDEDKEITTWDELLDI